MLDVRYSTKFKKDFKACVKRRYNMALLQQIIDTLKIPDTLPPSLAVLATSSKSSSLRVVLHSASL